MANAEIYLEVDTSDLMDEIDRLKNVMKPEQVDRVMYGIFQRTGRHVRQILKKELPKEYHVRAGEVSSAVHGAKVTSSVGLGVGCSIPIAGPRRDIGGTRGRGYPASGGAHGWKSIRRKYRIRASITKTAQSTLPQTMDSYGGMPPFRNFDAPKLNKLTFTRKGKDRLPIMKVVGTAIPQMPMNRSEEDVQEDIKKYMNERIEHEFQRVIAGGR